MKKSIILTFFLTLFPLLSIAQIKSLGIGGNIGGNFLFGDTRVLNSQIGLNSGIYGIYYISSRFGIKLQIGYGEFGFKPEKISTTFFIPAELDCIFSLLPITKFTPFLHVGLGTVGFAINNSKRYYSQLFIGGGGISIPISSKFSFLITTDMRYTTRDDFNRTNMGLNDAYVSFQTGLTYRFGKTPQKYEPKEWLAESRILAQKEEEYQQELIPIDSTNILNLKNEINSITFEIEELGKLISLRDNEIQEITKQITEKKEHEIQVVKIEQPVNHANGQIKQEYDNALTAFESREYQTAIRKLSALHEAFPEHFLARNFEYWIGECYFGLQRYEGAIKVFKDTENFINSFKFDDALLMAGISYMKIDDTVNARQKFEKLLKQNPNSEYVGKANIYLQSLPSNI